jgi:hypothetical protein
MFSFGYLGLLFPYLTSLFPHPEKSEWFISKPIGIEALIRKVESRLNHN